MENDTGAYVNQVSRVTGIQPDEPINLDDAMTLDNLVRAIIYHENGVQPYSVEQIREGVRRALL
ncbi:hypothetical protein D3C85_1560660 [compost metagenome]